MKPRDFIIQSGRLCKFTGARVHQSYSMTKSGAIAGFKTEEYMISNYDINLDGNIYDPDKKHLFIITNLNELIEKIEHEVVISGNTVEKFYKEAIEWGLANLTQASI